MIFSQEVKYLKFTKNEIETIQRIFSNYIEKNSKKIGSSSDRFIDFKKESIYVDKSLIIKEILKHHNHLFITAPRRWGKSLILSMIRVFFQPDDNLLRSNNENVKLFEDLKIYKEKIKIQIDGKNEEVNIVEHFQGKYPVIYLNFKAVYGDKNEIIKQLKTAIARAFNEHKYLIVEMDKNLTSLKDNSSKIIKSLLDKIEIENLERDIKNFSKYLNETNENLEKSIFFLSRLLDKYYKKGDKNNKEKIVIILVDEFDKPIHHFLGNFLKMEEKEKEAKELTNIATRISKMIGGEAKDAIYVKKIVLT